MDAEFKTYMWGRELRALKLAISEGHSPVGQVIMKMHLCVRRISLKPFHKMILFFIFLKEYSFLHYTSNCFVLYKWNKRSPVPSQCWSDALARVSTCHPASSDELRQTDIKRLPRRGAATTKRGNTITPNWVTTSSLKILDTESKKQKTICCAVHCDITLQGWYPGATAARYFYSSFPSIFYSKTEKNYVYHVHVMISTVSCLEGIYCPLTPVSNAHMLSLTGRSVSWIVALLFSGYITNPCYHKHYYIWSVYHYPTNPAVYRCDHTVCHHDKHKHKQTSLWRYTVYLAACHNAHLHCSASFQMLGCNRLNSPQVKRKMVLDFLPFCAFGKTKEAHTSVSCALHYPYSLSCSFSFYCLGLTLFPHLLPFKFFRILSQKTCIWVLLPPFSSISSPAAFPPLLLLLSILWTDRQHSLNSLYALSNPASLQPFLSPRSSPHLSLSLLIQTSHHQPPPRSDPLSLPPVSPLSFPSPPRPSLHLPLPSQTSISTSPPLLGGGLRLNIN